MCRHKMAWLPFKMGQRFFSKKSNNKIIPIDIHINRDDLYKQREGSLKFYIVNCINDCIAFLQIADNIEDAVAPSANEEDTVLPNP